MTIATGSVSSPSLNIENTVDAGAPSVFLPAPKTLAAANAELQNSLPEATPSGLNGLVFSTLAATFKRLDERLAAVSWPDSASTAASGNALANTAQGSGSGTSASAGAAGLTGTQSEDAAIADVGGVDPEALTTLAPGSYTLGYAAAASGSGAEQAVIRVYGGDTWQDVLQRLSRVLGSASVGMLSRLVPVNRNALSLPQHETGQSAAAASGTGQADAALGEAAPMRVAAPVARLADALGDVLASYNEVGGLLAANVQAPREQASKTQTADEQTAHAAAAADWTGLAAARAPALASVGVLRAGTSLWLSEESFLTAYWSDPAATRATLAGPEGLLTALQNRADEALGAGGSALAGVASAASPTQNAAGPDMLAAPMAPKTEAQVERGGQVLDTYDDADNFSLDALGVGGAGALLRRQG
ncbi:hypothetical protein [Humidesulfovibrio idahonensis]